MAIRTVHAGNLAEFVAERTAKGAQIATGEQMVEAADRINAAKTGDRTSPTPGNPVISTGTAETVATTPDPGVQPTASARAEQIAKSKAGTDPGVQKRIDDAIRAQKEAEEFAEDEYNGRLRAERRATDLEAQLKTAKPVTETKVEQELKRPSPKDFTDQAAYDSAMEAYEGEREKRLVEKIRAETRQQVLVDRQNELLSARIEVAKKDIPDFVEVIEAADRVKVEVPEHVKTAIIESQLGPQLAYHLAKFPDEQKRIFALSPANALLELGKIELKYTKPVATIPAKAANGVAPIETTRAPAPVTTLKAETGNVPVDLSRETDFVKYREARMEQIRARRRNRH